MIELPLGGSLFARRRANGIAIMQALCRWQNILNTPEIATHSGIYMPLVDSRLSSIR